MQKENVKRDNRILIDFWDQVFTLSEEQKAQLRNQQEDWKELAPSEKLFQAAFSLGGLCRMSLKKTGRRNRAGK